MPTLQIDPPTSLPVPPEESGLYTAVTAGGREVHLHYSSHDRSWSTDPAGRNRVGTDRRINLTGRQAEEIHSCFA